MSVGIIDHSRWASLNYCLTDLVRAKTVTNVSRNTLPIAGDDEPLDYGGGA